METLTQFLISAPGGECAGEILPGSQAAHSGITRMGKKALDVAGNKPERPALCRRCTSYVYRL